MDNEELNLSIGDALRLIRHIKKVTQEELSQRTGLTINYLSRLENGKKGASQCVMEKISRALGIPASFLYLLGDQSEDPIVQDLKNAVMESIAKEREKPCKKKEVSHGCQPVLN